MAVAVLWVCLSVCEGYPFGVGLKENQKENRSHFGGLLERDTPI